MSRDRSAEELARTATATGGANPSAAPVRPAQTLGRYRLDRQLGAGGMGVVHAALDIDLERRVAIKLLRAGPSHDARVRLLREAKAMARLDHPNVVTVFEVDAIDGVDFIVMELVEGGTLADWLCATPRSPAEIIAAFVAAGRGLAAAHAAGVVHRDFKPRNVLCSPQGRILVTDFGLARDHDSVQADGVRTDSPAPLVSVTVSGAFVGTPAYMAPEQWDGGTISPAVDQFAFCVALWEALTGELPFRGSTIAELRTAVQRGAESLDIRRIPRHLRPVLLRGLALDPAERWPSMDALLAALDRRRSAAPVAAFAAFGTLAVVAVAAWLVTKQPSSRPVPDAHTADETLDVIRAVEVPQAHSALIATIRNTGEGRYTVPRATIRQLVLDQTAFTEGARVVPAIEDETVRGFRLLSVRPRSIYAAFGLRDFDTLVSINGHPLTSTDALVAIYEQTRVAPVITVELVRRGTSQQLIITITP